MAGQLADAGDYTITASSADGKSTGKFRLYLAKAETLTPDASVKGHTDSDTYAYYSYSSGSPFSLAYEKQGGDFAPTVMVNRVDNHEMKEVGTLGGKQISKGSLGIKPEENGLYIVSIGEGTLDINFEKVTVDYGLTLSASK